MNDVTQLLVAWGKGDPSALESLVPLVEGELRRLALSYIRKEKPGHSLDASALVNEAYVRLIDWKAVEWQNRSHFFAVAAKMMRRILVDHAARRQHLKHGAGAVRVTLSDVKLMVDEPGIDIIALDAAMLKLAAFDERKSRIVELRFFGGLTEEEVAGFLDVPLRTVQREWNLARAWLFRELQDR